MRRCDLGRLSARLFHVGLRQGRISADTTSQRAVQSEYKHTPCIAILVSGKIRNRLIPIVGLNLATRCCKHFFLSVVEVMFALVVIRQRY